MPHSGTVAVLPALVANAPLVVDTRNALRDVKGRRVVVLLSEFPECLAAHSASSVGPCPARQC